MQGTCITRSLWALITGLLLHAATGMVHAQSAQMTIVGSLEPWEMHWHSEIQIGAILTSQREDIGAQVEPDSQGFFSLTLPASAELEKLLLGGEVAVAAYWKKRHLIGLHVLKFATMQSSIAIRLPILLGKPQAPSTD